MHFNPVQTTIEARKNKNGAEVTSVRQESMNVILNKNGSIIPFERGVTKWRRLVRKSIADRY